MLNYESICFKTPGWKERLNIEYIKTCQKISSEEQIKIIKNSEQLKGISEIIEYRNRYFRYNFDKKAIEYLGLKEEISDIPLANKNCLPSVWVEYPDVGFYYRNIELELLCDEYDFKERIETYEGLSEIVEYNGYYFCYDYDVCMVYYLGTNNISKDNPIKKFSFETELWENHPVTELQYRNSFLDKICQKIKE